MSAVAIERLARLARHVPTLRACELFVVIRVRLSYWAEETVWSRLPVFAMDRFTVRTEALAKLKTRVARQA